MDAGSIPPDLAGKVLAADVRNVVKKVGDGDTLPAAHRKMMQNIALTPELAAQQRAASHLARYCEGEDLTAAQWEEVRAAHPGFAAVPTPPTVAAAAAAQESAPAFALASDGRTAKLTTADATRYAVLYKGSEKGWRTIYRWIEVGEKSGEHCPLHDPGRMPGWWSRNMKHRVPEEIEAAAVAAARAAAHVTAPAPETTVPDLNQPQSRPASPKPPPAGEPAGSPPPMGSQKSVRLEDFDPEEGDRLRELKQLQAAKFEQLRAALELGQDTSVMEQKYIKLCETLDKIESRVIERMKKRGLYVLREDVDRDLAANAEYLRQTRESMVRRVLENCPTLTAEQKVEVSTAVYRARAREDSILAKLDCLKTDDLLRELAAA